MQREKPERQTIVINTPSSSGNWSTFAQEALVIPAFHNKSKEEISLKLNSLNRKKARCESHKCFLIKYHKEEVLPQGLSIYIEGSLEIKTINLAWKTSIVLFNTDLGRKNLLW